MESPRQVALVAERGVFSGHHGQWKPAASGMGALLELLAMSPGS